MQVWCTTNTLTSSKRERAQNDPLAAIHCSRLYWSIRARIRTTCEGSATRGVLIYNNSRLQQRGNTSRRCGETRLRAVHLGLEHSFPSRTFVYRVGFGRARFWIASGSIYAARCNCTYLFSKCMNVLVHMSRGVVSGTYVHMQTELHDYASTDGRRRRRPHRVHVQYRQGAAVSARRRQTRIGQLPRLRSSWSCRWISTGRKSGCVWSDL